MHIALVSRWYPPHTGYGGVAAYTYYLAHALTELGHRVTVVAARWSPDIPALVQDGGVTVHRLLAQYRYWPQRLPVVGRYIRPIRQIRYSLQVARKLHELEITDRPDIIEFADVEAEALAYLLKPRRCISVVRCHAPTFILRHYYLQESLQYNTVLTEYMEKYCISHADALTAPSMEIAQRICKECDISQEHFNVIPNPLNINAFAEHSKKYEDTSCPAKECSILYVGRMDWLKGMNTLIEAIPKVLKEVPNVRFTLIGDDRSEHNGLTWQEHLQACLPEKSSREQVSFVGPVDQPKLPHCYQQADIAVIPSMYESFSYTCAQAMAVGLPVVASRVGGIPETLGNCGLLVPVADSDALATALCKLVREPDLRRDFGQRASQRARQSFDALVIASQTLAMYQKVLARLV